jgi:hypothetical protein
MQVYLLTKSKLVNCIIFPREAHQSACRGARDRLMWSAPAINAPFFLAATMQFPREQGKFSIVSVTSAHLWIDKHPCMLTVQPAWCTRLRELHGWLLKCTRRCQGAYLTWIINRFSKSANLAYYISMHQLVWFVRIIRHRAEEPTSPTH